ncbi:DUF5813 family protein [Candidatus Halobonum tyrrellensis]|uniref:Uncharacterized protein n=1 Tax=Candidatus Halobonum tyrrellensis G22 TaxID=1324957 RepID=V4HDM5_9EURY|nr:DUF5813 family protein [Candidatus Halobonum tyrrellensis]ESP88178.1 hypothetical protein K933_10220 [Candidatus Halobonum tyrrellensis G22]
MTDGNGDESGVPERVRRAARDHDALGDPAGGGFPVTSTPFDGRIAVDERDDGRLAFDVTVRVPTLSAVAVDEVADVVDEGWYDTFERRVADIGAVTEGDHDLSPATRRAGEEAVVEASLTDLNERRGVNDAVAVVDYVEGTYVQGVVPGYEYTDPVAGLIDRARAAGGSGDY